MPKLSLPSGGGSTAGLLKSHETRPVDAALRVRNLELICEYFGTHFSSLKELNYYLRNPKQRTKRFLTIIYDGNDFWLHFFTKTRREAIQRLTEEMSSSEDFPFGPFSPNSIHDLDSGDPFEGADLEMKVTIRRRR